jgi:superfamily II DNA or RNA helicase
MHFAVPLPGEVVWIRQRRWRVERARRDRNVVRLDVRNRDARLTFLAPFDRPSTVERGERLRRVRPRHAAARLAQLVGRAHTWSTIASAIDASIDILPYQLEPALAVLNGARRVLIADAVGLGKTIQAGLVVAEVHRRSATARTLIVVPAPLRDQWIDELRSKFRIESRAADRQMLDEVARHHAYGDNPWREPGVWIASLDYVKQPHVLESLPPAPWDLLIVDEAHVASGDSERHDACAELARRARRVLLLSATPHSGDETRFARFVGLGRLDEEPAMPVVFRRTRSSVGFDLPRCVRWHGVRLSEAEERLLDALAAFEASALRAAGHTHRDAAVLLLSVFRKRAMSTMGALLMSLDRRLVWLGDGHRADEFEWLQPQLAFDDDSDELDDVDRQALTGDIGLRSPQERSWLRRLRGLAEIAARFDSKARRVAALVGRAREPVVIFTEFRHSLEVLQRRLQFSTCVAQLHGGLTPAERRQQLRRFLDGSAGTLITTDVGGQGLNLQDRARWVVSLELPWNPMKLEQRCGRVDRIGQSKPVHFTLMVARHEFERGLLARLAKRALIARRSIGEDVLSGIAPETAIGSALLDGDTMNDSETRVPRLVVCHSQARPARQMSRRLRAARVLAGRWRVSAPEAAGSVWTSLGRLPEIRRASRDRSVLVFSVPLLDGTGSVVERHIVAVGVAGLDRVPDPALIEAARSVAARTLGVRVRRLQVRLQRNADAEIRFESAIVSRLLTEELPRETQPGLFDRRELREFDAAKTDADEIRQALDDRRADLNRMSEIAAGRPVLELSFIRDEVISPEGRTWK